uniref:STAS domain-containing protein n=1 Tax=Streptomyces sp. CA-141956 TaxID=3240051 RepID=UPI003F49B41C
MSLAVRAAALAGECRTKEARGDFRLWTSTACTGFSIYQPNFTVVVRLVEEAVVLDLAGLKFCDWAGLGALIGAGNAAHRRGTVLYVLGVPAGLARLARATGTSLAAASGMPVLPARRG